MTEIRETERVRNEFEEANHSRRKFLSGATAGLAVVGAIGVASPFIASFNPSAQARAVGAPVKVDISKILPGEQIRVEWRGQPVFVLRRTKDIINQVLNQDHVVADPTSKESKQPRYVDIHNRSIKEDILVLLGICTHLGCSPQFRPEVGPSDLGAEWKGGYFCPCHGSKFDFAGRVYKNMPAPKNLTVPAHRYDGDDVIIIGEDQEVV